MSILSKTTSRLVLTVALMGAGFSASQVLVPTLAYADAVRLEAPNDPGFADLVEAVSPAVVSVRVKSNINPVSDSRSFSPRGFEDLPDDHPMRRFFDNGRRGDSERRGERPRQRRAQPISQGSGFFISDDGFLVTNNHVIENGTEFSVVMDDGTELEARLIGADSRTDLAVLKVDQERKFTYVAFGDNDSVRVGQWVVAVGNPFGLGGTVTAGIVSARGRDIGSGPYDDYLQIDAAVNRGNSGGPTFNLAGEVVGVNTAIFSPSGGNVGIAFAVPASVASTVVADLMDDGLVQRGWLGVRIQPVTDEIAESLGLDSAEGAIVADAEQGAPAATAGIKSGDVIIAVDGKSIKGPRELSRAIADFEPGSTVKVDVFRGGKEQKIDVKLGELPTQTAALAPNLATPDVPLEQYGLVVSPAEDGNGLVITEVDPEGRAADVGLAVGDVVTEVNNEPVATASEMEAAIAAVRQDGRGAVLLRVEANNTSRYVALPFEG